MRIPRLVVWMFPVGAMVLGAGVTSGQNYPNKPIRILTTEPGSSNDLVARLIAQGLSRSLDPQAIVDNRGILSGELVAKAKPGELNYASGPAGSSNHLAPELFKTMAGVDMVRIPYKGGGPALNALIGGQSKI